MRTYQAHQRNSVIHGRLYTLNKKQWKSDLFRKAFCILHQRINIKYLGNWSIGKENMSYSLVASFINWFCFMKMFFGRSKIKSFKKLLPKR